jgi:hypothetical protein
MGDRKTLPDHRNQISSSHDTQALLQKKRDGIEEIRSITHEVTSDIGIKDSFDSDRLVGSQETNRVCLATKVIELSDKKRGT